MWPHRSVWSRTSACRAEYMGSNPIEAANSITLGKNKMSTLYELYFVYCALSFVGIVHFVFCTIGHLPE